MYSGISSYLIEGVAEVPGKGKGSRTQQTSFELFHSRELVQEPHIIIPDLSRRSILLLLPNLACSAVATSIDSCRERVVQGDANYWHFSPDIMNMADCDPDRWRCTISLSATTGTEHGHGYNLRCCRRHKSDISTGTGTDTAHNTIPLQKLEDLFRRTFPRLRRPDQSLLPLKPPQLEGATPVVSISNEP